MAGRGETQLIREAVKHGASVEDDSFGRWSVFQCRAPDGCVWSASKTSLLRVEWLAGDSAHRRDAVQDAVERMSLGVEDCDEEEE